MQRLVRFTAAAGVAAVGVAIAVAPAGASSAAGNAATRHGHFQHLVVIYEENHSFDNLYGGWGSVNGQPVDGIGGPGYSAHATQVDQSSAPINCLFQNDADLGTTSQSFKWLDGTSHPGLQSPACTLTLANGSSADSHFTSSQPFALSSYVTPSDRTCAPPNLSAANGVLKNDPQGLPGGCTRDIVHRFYQEQYQLDGGKQDRYSVGSDAAGLTQGYYDTTSLPIYSYLHSAGAPNYVIADHFFQSAFGGSFLNHQFLIAAKAPVWNGLTTAQNKNSKLDSAGFPNSSYPLYKSQAAATYNDGPVTEACPSTGGGTDAAGDTVDANGRACGNNAINTVQPTNQPSAGGSNTLPLINDTDPSAPNYESNIGDELSAAGVSWNWYSGGWNDANAGHPDPLFQYHHQPFNYFANYAPGMPGRSHLLDETDFTSAAQNGTLPAVSFIKPIGEENEHPGYASTDNGESHLVDLIKTIEGGPEADSTLIVVTYDEFGGQWDHVAPPGQGNTDGPHDAYGPGTRVPALVIGKPVQQSGVDSASYDTTSILATIEAQWGVAPLGYRDAHVNNLLGDVKQDAGNRSGNS